MLRQFVDSMLLPTKHGLAIESIIEGSSIHERKRHRHGERGLLRFVASTASAFKSKTSELSGDRMILTKVETDPRQLGPYFGLVVYVLAELGPDR